MLIEPDWLSTHLHDPDVRVVELDVNSRAYDEWHIEGAVLWNVYRDLKGPDYRPVDDRAIAALLALSGITDTTTVVCYGYAPALGYWLLKLYGQRTVGILNVSRTAWRAEGYPVTAEVTPPPPAEPRRLAPDPELRADPAAVRDTISDESTLLLDVRSAAEYDGERFWPSGGMEPGGRAGHVPSAVSLPLPDMYDERGAFLAPARLRAALGVDELEGDRMITYCTIGGRAAAAWYATSELLGRGGVRVYDGSWAEWGRLPGSAVESRDPVATKES